MPNIIIDLAAEFTGKKAFDKAGSSTTALEKNVKKLGRTIGLTFSTAAVLAYSKASIKAASDDIRAQKQLALSLKNVGLERDAATAEGYIQRLESELGIIDDKLRPAYASLAIATKDTAETQRILGIALDISASTGKDLETVVAALSKAYLGNNTTLSKLGIGIAKADLKTKSFKEITDQLAVTFAGSAKASADSFAGSIDKLSIASNNAKEIIGTSLINALQSLGEDKSIDGLSTSIENAAKSLANFIDSIVYLKGEIASIPGANIVSGAFGLVSGVLGKFSPQRLAELIKAIKGFQGMGNVAMTGGSNMDTQKYEAMQKKILADQKKLAAAKIKADKLAAANKLKLEKAASVFDLTKIQIAAALKGKISEEEKTRLLLMQAIADEDAKKAEELAKKLEEIQKKNAEIAKSLTEISNTSNPFQAWADSLGVAAAILGGMPALINASGGLTGRGKVTLPTGDGLPDPGTGGGGGTDSGGTGGGGGTGSGNTSIFGANDTPQEIADKTANAAEDAAAAATAAAASVVEEQKVVEQLAEAATNGSATESSSMYNGNPYSAVGGPGYGIPYPPSNVYINVEGSMLSSDEYVKAVTQALVEGTTNGYNTYRPGAVLP